MTKAEKQALKKRIENLKITTEQFSGQELEDILTFISGLELLYAESEIEEFTEIATEAKKGLNKKCATEISGVKICTINGDYVRTEQKHIEFTMGGHHYVYEYIPEDEIWIDENLSGKPNDFEATILHENTERNLMKEAGLSYDDAHEIANVVETRYRDAGKVETIEEISKISKNAVAEAKKNQAKEETEQESEAKKENYTPETYISDFFKENNGVVSKWDWGTHITHLETNFHSNINKAFKKLRKEGFIDADDENYMWNKEKQLPEQHQASTPATDTVEELIKYWFLETSGVRSIFEWGQYLNGLTEADKKAEHKKAFMKLMSEGKIKKEKESYVFKESATTEQALTYEQALERFIKLLTEREIKYTNEEEWSDENKGKGYYVFSVEKGQKYDRILASANFGRGGGSSAYAFINKATGGIMKPAGWKAPEPRHYERGNIYGANPLSGTTRHGVVYYMAEGGEVEQNCKLNDDLILQEIEQKYDLIKDEGNVYEYGHAESGREFAKPLFLSRKYDYLADYLVRKLKLLDFKIISRNKFKGGSIYIEANPRKLNWRTITLRISDHAGRQDELGVYAVNYDIRNINHVKEILNKYKEKKEIKYKPYHESEHNEPTIHSIIREWGDKSKSIDKRWDEAVEQKIEIITNGGEYHGAGKYILTKEKLGSSRSGWMKYKIYYSPLEIIWEEKEFPVRCDLINKVFPLSEDFELGGKINNESQVKAIFKKFPSEYNIYAVEAETKNELCHIFVRAQAFYESNKFKDKVFTLDEFKQWYSGDGDFTYYDDWRGFNIPDYSIQKFIDGRFEPLSVYERWLMENIKETVDTSKPFYIVGYADGYDDTKRHELSHALYYLCPEYKKAVDKVIKSIPKSELKTLVKFLEARKYSKSVYPDEMQAYIMADKQFMIEQNGWIDAYQPYSDKLNKIFDEHFGVYAAGGNVYDRGDRPSPRESATLYSEGYEMEGQDGYIWKIIVVSGNGQHRWSKTNRMAKKEKPQEVVTPKEKEAWQMTFDEFEQLEEIDRHKESPINPFQYYKSLVDDIKTEKRRLTTTKGYSEKKRKRDDEKWGNTTAQHRYSGKESFQKREGSEQSVINAQNKLDEFLKATIFTEKELKNTDYYDYEINDIHKRIIKKALSEGKQVPQEVLDGYPELKSKQQKANNKQQTVNQKRIDLINKIDTLKSQLEYFTDDPDYKGYIDDLEFLLESDEYAEVEITQPEEQEEKSILNQKTDLRGGEKDNWMTIPEKIESNDFKELGADKGMVAKLLRLTRENKKQWKKSAVAGIPAIEKLRDSIIDLEKAIINGDVKKAISEGRITSSDAKIIIESAGLEVPHDILEMAERQTTNNEQQTYNCETGQTKVSYSAVVDNEQIESTHEVILAFDSAYKLRNYCDTIDRTKASMHSSQKDCGLSFYVPQWHKDKNGMELWFRYEKNSDCPYQFVSIEQKNINVKETSPITDYRLPITDNRLPITVPAHPEVKTDLDTVLEELYLGEIEKMIYQQVKENPQEYLYDEESESSSKDIIIPLEFDFSIKRDNAEGEFEDTKTDIENLKDEIFDLDEDIKATEEQTQIDELKKTLEQKNKKLKELDAKKAECEKEIKKLQAKEKDAEESLREYLEGFISFESFDKDDIFSLSEEGLDMVNRINARLETRKGVAQGLDLFPEQANIPEMKKYAAGGMVKLNNEQTIMMKALLMDLMFREEALHDPTYVIGKLMVLQYPEMLVASDGKEIVCDPLFVAARDYLKGAEASLHYANVWQMDLNLVYPNNRKNYIENMNKLIAVMEEKFPYETEKLLKPIRLK